MPVLKAKCPSCEALLKVGNLSLAGKVVKCPKCTKPFKLPELSADDTESADAESSHAPDSRVKGDAGQKAGPRTRLEEDRESRAETRKKRRDDGDEEDERPRNKRRDNEEDEEDDKPRKKRRDEDDEEEKDAKPRASRRDDEIDEEDAKPHKKRRGTGRDDDSSGTRKGDGRTSRKKKKTAKSKRTLVIAIGGAVAFLVVAGGLGIYFSSPTQVGKEELGTVGAGGTERLMIYAPSSDARFRIVVESDQSVKVEIVTATSSMVSDPHRVDPESKKIAEKAPRSRSQSRSTCSPQKCTKYASLELRNPQILSADSIVSEYPPRVFGIEMVPSLPNCVILK